MSETVAEKSEPKSYVRTLSDGKNVLQFLANQKKDGSFSTYVAFRERDGGKTVKTTRGNSATYSSLAEAKAAIEGGVSRAIGEGWKERKAGSGNAGFKPKPDSFTLDTLPKPQGV